MRYPASDARAVAADIIEALRPHCDRIEIAGSLRRQSPTVGDIEILYIPHLRAAPAEGDMFDWKPSSLINEAELAITDLLKNGIIDQRLNINDQPAWGPLNKFAVHRASDIPVDLFAATPTNWWNYLTCRTGGAETNKSIAAAARFIGWKWNPYGPGFTKLNPPDMNMIRRMDSERQVFDHVRLPYLPPELRP